LKTLHPIWRGAAIVLAVLLLGAGIASAQLQSGNLYGTTKDDKGAVLPGVSVTLSGQGAPQTQVTDAEGAFRFLGLSPGSYALKSELQGFSTVDYPNIVIGVGRNTTIVVQLSAAVEDVITVTAESPLLDEKAIRTGNTVSQTELSRIPTSRDPWAILSSTPGVLSDRINVGGNESGQQALFVGPGSMAANAVFSLDGMVITDMTATGSSPGYFDFDSFEEIQVTTGGSDASIATGGVALNMVTKRGTNEWRGSARYFYTDDNLQGNLDFDRGELGKSGPWNLNNAPQTSFNQGNRVSKIQDYGFEIGGPIIKDKLWIWGAYAKPKIDLLTINNFFDKTTLEDKNVKLNWQIVQSNSLTGFYFDSNKSKIGRNAGPSRPQETTWDQGKFGPSPTAYKAEDTHIFSSNFYLTALYSKVNGGFTLAPEGGDVPYWQDSLGTFHDSFVLIEILRPQEQAKLDASVFFNTGNLSHELKFGGGRRTADQESLSHTSGGYFSQAGSLFNLPPTKPFVVNVGRDGFVDVSAQYDTVYAHDTLTVGNLTANIGLRYDKQGGDNNAHAVAANRFRPDLLPAVNYAGGPAGFEWKSITPRIGVTYALGAERKTLLRASFSQFADQLGTGTLSQLNPLGAQSYAYFYSPTPVANGALPAGCCAGSPAGGYSSNVNPLTGGLIQSNQVAKGLDAPLTSEALLSVEHALLPEFTVGINLTYRRLTDLLDTDLLVFDCAPGDSCATSASNLSLTGRRASSSDFEVVKTLTGTLPTGSTYSLPVYGLRDGVDTRGGTVLRNSAASQTYKGASLVFTKRLSNRWMFRGNLSFSDWTWDTPASAKDAVCIGTSCGPNRSVQDDGQQVVLNSGVGSGSKGNVFINSNWSYSFNGLYQIAPDRPWGFNVAGTLTGRQGYPVVYLRNGGNLFNLGSTQIPVTDNDAIRLDNINQLDARIEKDLRISDFGVTLSVDCFNVLNRATVLQRRGRLNAANSDFVQEIVSPRLFRVGAKFSFR